MTKDSNKKNKRVMFLKHMHAHTYMNRSNTSGDTCVPKRVLGPKQI